MTIRELSDTTGYRQTELISYFMLSKEDFYGHYIETETGDTFDFDEDGIALLMAYIRKKNEEETQVWEDTFKRLQKLLIPIQQKKSLHTDAS